jgi:hypothetical protein
MCIASGVFTEGGGFYPPPLTHHQSGIITLNVQIIQIPIVASKNNLFQHCHGSLIISAMKSLIIEKSKVLKIEIRFCII